MFTALARTLCLWVIIEPLPALAQVDRCAGEEAQLAREQAELPALDLTPPLHRQVVCISLETLSDFSKRMRAHLSRCPGSPHAAMAATWHGLRQAHAAQFRRHHCRRHW